MFQVIFLLLATIYDDPDESLSQKPAAVSSPGTPILQTHLQPEQGHCNNVLNWISVPCGGLPGIAFFWTVGGFFKSNICEDKSCDALFGVLLQAIRMHSKTYNLHVTGKQQKNTNGDSVKVFMKCLDMPISLQQAKLVATQFCNIINDINEMTVPALSIL